MFIVAMEFNSAGSRSFNNDIARNVTIFGVDNSSSPHANNRKNNYLMLGEGPTSGINESFGSPEKNFSIHFSNQTQNFAWVSNIMLMIVICFLMEKKSLSLKPTMKMLTFQLNFVFEVHLMNLVLLSLE